MYRFITAASVLALVLSTTAGCGDDTPTAPDPTPTPPAVTDTFSGTVNRNGAQTHTFAVSRSGLMTATLTTLAPNSALVVGVSLGTWNGTTCQIVLANDRATQGSVVSGNGGSAGNFCVRVYDVGNIGDAVEYQVTVVHF
jgi:hypothetical protein